MIDLDKISTDLNEKLKNKNVETFVKETFEIINNMIDKLDKAEKDILLKKIAKSDDK